MGRHSHQAAAPRRYRHWASTARGEQGSTLVIALICMIVMGVIISALTSYAYANNRSTVTYRSERNERSAGDRAIQSAINWVKSNGKLGRDPSLDSTDPACVQYVTTEVGTVTASCSSETGGGSGKPADGGLVPPESMLVLGDRKTSSSDPGRSGTDEPGPYSVPDCKGWWDTVVNWFQTGKDPDLTGPGEWGAWFLGRKGLTALDTTCDNPRARSRSDFNIRGDVVAAGHIQVSDGGNVVIVDGAAKARNGCTGGGLAGCATPGTRSYPNALDPLNYLNGTAQDTDPGRTTGTSPMNTKSPFLPVGFNADGSLQAQSYTPTGAMPSAMPNRTTAYTWNTDGTLTATAGCVNAATTIIFLPGWYQDANVLNKYTGQANTGCKDVTFWFAPDPGADGKLLTGDDLTGAYYFDFRSGSGQACQSLVSNVARWCIGDNATSNPDTDVNARIVAGTPQGWSPLGSATSAPPGSTDTRSRVRVAINQATIVDKDLSQSWLSSPNPDTAAASINGTAAHYTADFCIFAWCISQDRAIRVRGFSPKVSSPPIDEAAAGSLPAASKGRVFVQVAYGITNPTSADAAKVQITTVSEDSPTGNCGPAGGGDGGNGIYNLYTNKSDADYATGLHTYTFTAAQAKTLADYCGTVDQLNGLEIKLIVTGNGDNYPDKNDVYFDGASFYFDSFEGANFPNPVGTGTNASRAKSDCDPTKPGAQLIFGGQSHVYVGDGSLEVCAGPYPTDPENHQSIGIYGLPAVQELNATGVSGSGGNDADAPGNPGNVTKIDGQTATINYGGCPAFCGPDFEEGWIDLPMQSYTPPAGYDIAKVEARVSYNPKNQGCSFLWSCDASRAPQLQFKGMSGCSDRDYPRNPDKGPLQVANWTTGVLYEAGSSATNSNCLTPSRLAGGVTLRWAARAECSVAVCKVGGGQWHDEFDGIALQITLKPSSSATARLLPQSGCITAHPNYNGGSGSPDCAVLRADASLITDNWSNPFATKEGQSRGRASVKGTIYAPSSAIEVDDTDVAYPLATRGLVARHLRVSGWGFRQIPTTYSGTAIDNSINKEPAARETTFTSCIQSAARRSAGKKCGEADSGDKDKILTKARVRFAVRGSGNTATADIPQVLWWSDER